MSNVIQRSTDRTVESSTLNELLPSDHIRLLHPAERRGIVTVAQRGPGWQEVAIPICDLAAYLADKHGQVDLYVSQQSFWGWRRIGQLAQLGGAYVDLDYHTMDKWAGSGPETVTIALLEALGEQRIPPPSYVLSTGRGLLAVWLHSLVPRKCLPRWMAIQQQLVTPLAPFGADRRALDAARVFRLAGTRNSKTGATVRPTFMAAPVNQLWRWDFEELAFEILPRERADIVSLRTRRAARRARGDGPPPARTLTVATYWEAILTDLQRLLTIRWSGDLPPGHRDTWLFLAACAMSWLAPPAALRREVHSLAREVGGWTESEANSRLSTVLRRAEEAARGCTVEWKGQRVDPRYMFRALTVVEWLGITPAEMRDAGLRVLVDRDRRRELAAQRHEAYRRRTGIRARAAYDAARADAAQATGATKPWEIEGISRATWYRRHTTG